MSTLEVARVSYGAALLVWPGLPVRVCVRKPADCPARIAARVLGVRHLVQAVIVGRSGRRSLLAAGAAADTLHALSMIVLAALDARYRRPAAADAAVATLFAAGGFRRARGA